MVDDRKRVLRRRGEKEGGIVSDRIPDKHRRDLELLLIGAALAAESRDTTLTLVPDGFLSKEGDKLMYSMREGNPTGPLLDWLKERGAGPTRGGSATDAIIGRLTLENAKVSLNRIAVNINNTAKLGTVKQLVAALERSLEVAKGIKDIEEE